MDRPAQACPNCTNTAFLLIDHVSIEIATPGPGTDRHEGHAFVCQGCGRVDYFVKDIDALAKVANARVVMAVASDPYRT